MLPAPPPGRPGLGRRPASGPSRLAGAFGGEFKQDYLQPGSESQPVSNTLQDQLPAAVRRHVQIVVHADAGVTTPEVKDRVETILADVADAPHVVERRQPVRR